MYSFHSNEKTPIGKRVFVFGSNLAGRHGAGAALIAHREFGAILGRGEGRQGRSYAIPTKDVDLSTLKLNRIRGHVSQFIDYAREHDNEEFFVTRVGCGLAGYRDFEIAPLFFRVPTNCILPTEWQKWFT